jgi:methionyl-tRNA synthetase
MSRFSLTTTLPYVNAKPHIGFALEIIEADAIVRFHRLQGDEVVFNTGTDEHGTKIYEKAKELGQSPQAYCDAMSEHFRTLEEVLNISYTHFIRTTDEHHMRAAQEFWKRCEQAGDIYKKQYKLKYCVGCELEKTDSDLVNGKCADHPNGEITIIEEENYFFRFSKYQKPLLEIYRSREDFVLPKKRMNEIVAFVERGLQDFSISRLKSKMPWGIAVPNDDEHVMYVWFDALVNYISTLGWGGADAETFEKFWPSVQICGKDNLRQQAAMWQAMLLSAGITPSRQILVNGFITVDGQKMSKSVGNVISPEELVAKFGIDGTRYLLLSGAPIGEDMDVSWERLTEKYNADLANGLGNLVSRVVKLSEKCECRIDFDGIEKDALEHFREMLTMPYDKLIFTALEGIRTRVQSANATLEENKPWLLVKTNRDEFEEVLTSAAKHVYKTAYMLKPFLPETSEKIQTMLKDRKSGILFQRIDTKE